MRILLMMDPYIPVPPQHYGGIERVIADLAQSLHTRGHVVSLWAGPGSNAPPCLKRTGRDAVRSSPTYRQGQSFHPPRLRGVAGTAMISWRRWSERRVTFSAPGGSWSSLASCADVTGRG